ncbi:MAG: hypothetical protein IKK39_05695 [Thermoguttaceae bacterium]|nr:hypothetical protein [Thermoguttaceae bacterium]MBR4103542.1 hypothetical protein [Thermoguttaceae bacterium]
MLEANSACYYCYIGLNVDFLSDDEHLGKSTTRIKKRRSRSFSAPSWRRFRKRARTRCSVTPCRNTL